ncbi:hypothetical protein [Streptomyces sp. NPDC091416]
MAGPLTAFHDEETGRDRRRHRLPDRRCCSPQEQPSSAATAW